MKSRALLTAKERLQISTQTLEAERDSALLKLAEEEKAHEKTCHEVGALRAQLAQAREALYSARFAVKGFIVAQGPHLPLPWRDHLIEGCGLQVSEAGFVSLPTQSEAGKEGGA